MSNQQAKPVVDVDFGAGGHCPFDQVDQDGIEEMANAWVAENMREIPATETDYCDLTGELDKYIENNYWAQRMEADPEEYALAEPYWWGKPGGYGGYAIHVTFGGRRWADEDI